MGFAEGLESLVKAAEEEAQNECRQIAELRAQLDADRELFDRERQQFEEQRTAQEAANSVAAVVPPPDVWPDEPPKLGADWPTEIPETTWPSADAWPPAEGVVVPNTESAALIFPTVSETKWPGDVWPPADVAETEAKEARIVDPFLPLGRQPDDEVTLNVAGQEAVTVRRSTLVQHPDSMLAALIIGSGPPLPLDDAGRKIFNYPPAIFLPLIDYLKARETESGAELPDLGSDDLERHFNVMLQHLGLREWALHQEAVTPGITLEGYSYAVLPPRRPDETVAWSDMTGRTVTVPLGWEVLAAKVPDFDSIIETLTSYSWGSSVLCAIGAGGALETYPTRICPHGDAGRFVLANARPAAVPGSGDRQFSFLGAASCRLVIRKAVT